MTWTGSWVGPGDSTSNSDFDTDCDTDCGCGIFRPLQFTLEMCDLQLPGREINE